MNRENSDMLWERAKRVMPGGVNSPVRAYAAVGENPVFIKRAKGQYVYDEDGNRYTDYIGSWGPMILGHNDPRIVSAVKRQSELGMSYGACTKAEVLLAELICSLVPCVEMIRMVNSGTEAVMSAVRAARGFTGKSKVIKFEGCYHGHADMMLVRAGSGTMTTGSPDSLGVPEGCVKDTLSAVYNDIDSVKRLFERNRNEIACVIAEPVAANMGVVTPEKGFLRDLRKICNENNALLIFDEVITGFRLGTEGASGYFDVRPDLVTYGKIIGGGMPVGAYGGRKGIMSVVSPLGGVYQAGTLSGNPVAMEAGLAQLKALCENPQIYENINSLGEYMREGLRTIIEKHNLPYSVNGIGSLSTLFFSDKKIRDYGSAKSSDRETFGRFFRFMLKRGNFLPPSQFEAIFISAAHTKADIDRTLNDADDFFTAEKN